MWKKREKKGFGKTPGFSFVFPEFPHREKPARALALWAFLEKFTEFTTPTKTTK